MTNDTAWTEATMSDVEYIKWAEVEVGTLFEGIFMRTSESKFKTLNLHFDIEGNDIVLPASGILKSKMKKVNIGDNVQVTYLGMVPLESGDFKGKEAHDFTVFSKPVKEEA
jgi:hypothetical protein